MPLAVPVANGPSLTSVFATSTIRAGSQRLFAPRRVGPAAANGRRSSEVKVCRVFKKQAGVMSSEIARREFFVSAPWAVAGVVSAGAAAAQENPPNAKVVREPPRDTPVVHECDVCVIGGSCTGVFAAVAAARLGAKVAIVEHNGFFGGVATASLVNIWHSLWDLRRENKIVGGLTEEVIDRLRRVHAVTEHFRSAPGKGSNHYELNSEVLKFELDHLVVEAAIRPFLHTMFVCPVVEDGRMTAAIIEDKSGRRAIRARQFVDATGDADVIARMGLGVYQRENLQPPTYTCILRGMDKIARENPDFNINRVIFDTQYEQAIREGHSWTASVPGAEGHLMLAGARVFGVDCSDADQLTQASLDGRRKVEAICELVREHFQEGKGVPLAWLPAKIGVRETRHAHCRHTLTSEELLTGHRFEDAIGNGTYPIDVHRADRAGITWGHLPKNVPFYQIPFSSLVPRGAKNVLVAGRNIDADEGAFGAVRVMVNCNQMGQAAGVAAWQALDSDTPVDSLDMSKLRATLRDQGAVIV